MTDLVLKPELPRSLTPGVMQSVVDWRAFIAAAFLAPICLALCGAIGLHYGLFIGAITAVVSLPGYVFLGLPAAYIVITRFPDRNGQLSFGRIAMAALIAVALVVPLGGLAMMVWYGVPDPALFQSAAQYALVGVVIGPLEAVFFAALYREFARPTAPKFDATVFS